VHEMELCPGTDPPTGQRIEYRHYIALPSETPTVFAEWRVKSTGIAEELEYVAPSVFVIASTTTPENPRAPFFDGSRPRPLHS
jgi:hypothetical protein